MRRARAVIVVAAAALALAATVAAAQQPPPTVAVTAGPASVAVQAPGPIAAGPTRFDVTREASEQDLNVYIGLLDTGVSLEEFQAALRADDRSGGTRAIGLVSIQASLTLEGGATSRAVTFALKPGLTYFVLTEPSVEDGPPPSRGITTFTTGATANGSTAPTPAATVQMVDSRFRGDKVLPRRGVVRFENNGGETHFAIALPLRRRVTAAQVGRALRTGGDSAFGRILAGNPVTPQMALSGGGTANYQDVQFPRAGKYALVCFLNEHYKLGMYRVVTVR